MKEETIETMTKRAYEVPAASERLGERLARIAGETTPLPRPRLSLRPMMIAATVAAVVLAGAAIRIWAVNSGEIGFSDARGRQWRIARVHGSIRFLDPQGRTMAVTSVAGTDPREPTVVSVAGKRFVLRGPGRHEMRDEDGRLYGYAEVGAVQTTPSPKGRTLREMLDEREAAFQKSAGAGVQGGLGVALGHDARSAISWKIIGEARVSGRWPNGDEFASEARRFDPATLNRMGISTEGFSFPDTPRLTWRVGESSGAAEGYGVHEIRNASGRTRMTIAIERPLAKP